MFGKEKAKAEQLNRGSELPVFLQRVAGTGLQDKRG
jgi:hypothetical protein